ncbi:MAG: 1-acyl-sn-glycerol-3-phosphate acyltransferase [Fibrobacterota bacterium]
MSRPEGKRAENYTARLRNEMKGINKYVRRVFSKVELTEEDLDRLFSIDNEGVTIVCTHRSHSDYLVTGLEFITRGYQNLRFAAGDNLTGLPFIGILFRKVGSFSVQRSKVTSRQYLFKLADFVKRLLFRGQNVLIYPEGGRSYTGHMLEIKSGLIGSTVMAQKANPQKDYYIIPMACSYSIVPEAKMFSWLLRGKALREKTGVFSKAVGNLLYYGSDIWVYLRLWLFPPRELEIYIDVGTPVPVKSLTDVEGLYRSKAKNEFFANGVAIKECCNQIRHMLLRLYRILPHNIVAYALDINQHTPAEMLETADSVIAVLKQRGCNMKGLADMTTAEIIQAGQKRLVDTKICKRKKKGPVIKNPALIHYYSNAVSDILEDTP